LGIAGRKFGLFTTEDTEDTEERLKNGFSKLACFSARLRAGVDDET
jgi:hypothetical protein